MMSRRRFNWFDQERQAASLAKPRVLFVSRDELEDLDRPYADYRMVYGRVSPWAPWMLMGRRPGWMYYQVTARKACELADVPPKLLKYVETHDPEFLTIPEYREPLPPTLTSWESFARDRTPMP